MPARLDDINFERGLSYQEEMVVRAAFEEELDPSPRRTKSEEKRLRDIEERRRQGDRTDWYSTLRRQTCRPYRVTPYTSLSQSQKKKLAISLKAAAERRAKREGVVVHYDDRAFNKLSASTRAAFEITKPHLWHTTCPETGRPWLWEDLEPFYGRDRGEALEHLDVLFRSGRATKC